MKLLNLLAPIGLLLSSAVYAGGSLDLSINDETAGLEYDATRMGSPMHISAGFLYHEEDGELITFGLNAVDVRDSKSSLRIGVGGKVYGYFNDAGDGGALAVGGFVRYAPPELNGLGFAGHAYYAPSVLSFSDTENMVDVSARVEYMLLPTAMVYLGYRFIEANEDALDIEVANNGHFGLRINF
ncbi:YfaZ family protein [Oceaniserpentilla sp. 4NH20-0058]|uniref:YfaZ family outer membrane protein n=1 Tax=Oceaniserpentilla sp. 4NH20-0058 TaxID=3127660 RepID=UPI0031076BB4